jgi:hypothetical protein
MSPTDANPYRPPDRSAWAEPPTSSTPVTPRERLLLEGGLAQGVTLVFTLLGLFILIEATEALLRLVAVHVVEPVGSAESMTTSFVAIGVAGLAARCIAMILFVRRQPRVEPTSIVILVLWILVCLLGPPLKGLLDLVTTMDIRRHHSLENIGRHYMVMGVVNSALMVLRGVLFGLGFLLACLRWRNVNQQLNSGFARAADQGTVQPT